MDRLKIHMKKDHSGKKATEETLSTSYPTPSPTPTSSTPLIPLSTSAKPKPPVVDHRNDSAFKDISLESKNHFTSKYDRMIAEEKKRIHQSQYEKQKEIERQLKKPPTVYLSDSNQAFIQHLLQQQEDVMRGVELPTIPTEEIKGELRELGFSMEVIQKALNIPTNRTAVDCIDWCCIHLKDSDLPLQFRSSGNQMSLQKLNKGNETFLDYLLEFGFNEKAYREKVDRGMKDDMILPELLVKVIPDFTTRNRGSEEEMVLNEELEALKSIYYEIEERWFGDLQLLRYTGEEFTAVFVLSKSFSYPQCKPIVFIMAKEIAKHQRLDFMRFIYNKFEVGHPNLLYEIILDYEDLMKEYQKELLKPVTILSSHHSKRSAAPIRQHKTERIIDKQTLEGNPTPQVTKQRQDLPITKYRAEVLQMIQSNQISLVSGGTGCGKSTQVPQFLIEEFKQSNQKDLNIIVCEPRRISCLGLYNRILVEQGFSSGSSCPVGYQVRGDSK